MISTMRRNGMSIAFGAAIGLLATLAAGSLGWSLDDIAWRWYDDLRPVATITAKPLPGPVGEIRVELTVIRHRPECVFKGPAAFEMLPGGTAVRVFASRIDGQTAVNVPRGVAFQAEWRFWPIGIGKLRVWMEYQCDGRATRIEVEGLT